MRFATARLGKTVFDLEDVPSTPRHRRLLLDRCTWQLGPGDRIGLVGVNGAGKTTVLRLLAGERPTAGRVVHGKTVRLAHLSQELAELDPAAAGAGGRRRGPQARPRGQEGVVGLQRSWSASGSAARRSGRRSAICPAGSAAGCSSSGC